MIKLTINDKAIETFEGSTVLQAARANGIIIPTLCDYSGLSPSGNCRLCLVEIEGWPRQIAACTTPAADAMIVRTETAALIETRKLVLEMLWRRYVDTGNPTDATRESELLHWTQQYGVNLPESAPTPRFVARQRPESVCACRFQQVHLMHALRARLRGDPGSVRMGCGLSRRRCRHHRRTKQHDAGRALRVLWACVEVCPTGALDDRMSYGLGRPDKVVTTTCGYCGVGCQFDLNVKDNKIIRVTSNPEAPVNGISLCVKGRYGYDFVHHPERLTRPRVRKYLLEGHGVRDKKAGRGEWIEVDWDTALNIAAGKLGEARDTHGADSVGVLASAKCLNEENYLMNKFARQVVGTNGVDHCARLCHSSTVAGLSASFGSGAMTNSMDDIAAYAKAILIIGSNTTEQHPVFGSMIRQAVLRNGTKLVVADPRKIDITEFAAVHVRQRPGTDVALINGLMHIILQRGWEDKKFIAERSEGFEEFKAALMNYPPEKVAEITGVPTAQLCEAAEILGTNKPMAVVWAMGITQHIVGVCNVMDLANLQMLLGNIGISGGGVNPLRGQNNVQGACDMGALPDVYPGYQRVSSEEMRKKFEAAWGVALPEKIGMTVTEMIPAVLEGKTHALYMLGEDPVMSEPDSNHTRKCLDECDFIVLQEIFPSESSQFVDVLLPGQALPKRRAHSRIPSGACRCVAKPSSPSATLAKTGASSPISPSESSLKASASHGAVATPVGTTTVPPIS